MSRLGSCIRRVPAGGARSASQSCAASSSFVARELGFEIEAIRHLLALQDMPERVLRGSRRDDARPSC
jgi:hypothetical protein